jgi:hypothetical protein
MIVVGEGGGPLEFTQLVCDLCGRQAQRESIAPLGWLHPTFTNRTWAGFALFFDACPECCACRPKCVEDYKTHGDDHRP